MNRTRFAPSPTGPLHLGHAYAAWVAHTRGDEMLLRIEDIDQSRARPHWEKAIHEDLAWLGIGYPQPVMRQSERQDAYDKALDALWSQGLLYPCTCTRRDIETAASAPQEGAPLHGPDGVIYPGTCRPLTASRASRPHRATLRLNMRKAAERIGKDTLCFEETGVGDQGQTGLQEISLERAISEIGDVVVARKDMGSAYHLAVVVDDIEQGITEVTRGADLFAATAIHVILQDLLGVPTPQYHHHGLIRDTAGKRLAKRDDARSLAFYRDAGWAPEALIEMLSCDVRQKIL